MCATEKKNALKLLQLQMHTVHRCVGLLSLTEFFMMYELKRSTLYEPFRFAMESIQHRICSAQI